MLDLPQAVASVAATAAANGYRTAAAVGVLTVAIELRKPDFNHNVQYRLGNNRHIDSVENIGDLVCEHNTHRASYVHPPCPGLVVKTQLWTASMKHVPGSDLTTASASASAAGCAGASTDRSAPSALSFAECVGPAPTDVIHGAPTRHALFSDVNAENSSGKMILQRELLACAYT
jgi:hypothetical protein